MQPVMIGVLKRMKGRRPSGRHKDQGAMLRAVIQIKTVLVIFRGAKSPFSIYLDSCGLLYHMTLFKALRFTNNALLSLSRSINGCCSGDSRSTTTRSRTTVIHQEAFHRAISIPGNATRSMKGQRDRKVVGSAQGCVLGPDSFWPVINNTAMVSISETHTGVISVAVVSLTLYPVLNCSFTITTSGAINSTWLCTDFLGRDTSVIRTYMLINNSLIANGQYGVG
ncbi:hypothetical protein J6590_071318 [Homalodisca vitripennis]|nr:hypothetical protein J6590_071318 [Homalodisca vitripennis]